MEIYAQCGKIIRHRRAVEMLDLRQINAGLKKRRELNHSSMEAKFRIFLGGGIILKSLRQEGDTNK